MEKPDNITQMDTDNSRIEEIGGILHDLSKVVKVISVYPDSNPLPQSMRRSFSERLENVVSRHGELRLLVERDRLLLDDEIVLSDQSQESGVPLMFFNEGVTALTLKSGLGFDEINRFLTVLKETINAPQGTCRLIENFTDAALPHVGLTRLEDVALTGFDEGMQIQVFGAEDTDRLREKYGQGDSGQEYRSIFDLADTGSLKTEEDQLQSGALSLSDSGSIAQELAPTGLFSQPSDEAATAEESPELDRAVATPAPDAALILNDQFELDEEETATVRQLVEQDADFDEWESTVELVKELLHQESEMQAFYETVSIAEKIHGTFVQQARLVEAGLLIDYFKTLRNQIREDKPLWAERLRDATVMAGSRDQLRHLATALNQNEEIGAGEVRRYLDNFDWKALGGLSELLGDLDHRLHRDALCDFLAGCGEDNIEIISRGVADRRWHVVRNSTVILARIGSKEALRHLRKVVNHKEQRVRLALVETLKDNPSEDALEILRTASRDSDYEVRREAIDSIVARRGQPAYDAITDIINEKGFSNLEQREQQMLLTAYSVLGGEYALEYLGNLATQKNPLRNSSLTFLRMAAFAAMEHNRSEKCEKLLLKLASSWLPGIKKLAQETLKRRREVIYGGDDD